MVGVDMKLMWNRERQLIALRRDLKQWVLLWRSSYEFVSRHDDPLEDFSLYASLIDAAKFVSESPPTNEHRGSLPSDYVNQTQKLIQDKMQQLDQPNQRRLDRTPFLAHVRFCSMFEERPALLEAIMAYLARFSAKTCCALDLRSYLTPLASDVDASGRLLEFLSTGMSLSGDPEELVTVAKVKWMLTCRTVDTDSLVATAKEMVRRHVEQFNHERNETASGVSHNPDIATTTTSTMLNENSELDKQPTLRQRVTDGFAWLAIQMMWHLYERSHMTGYLIELLMLCHDVTSKIENAFYASLVAIKVYAILGAWGEVTDLCERLNVKYLQRDSLGYLLHHPLTAWGYFELELIWAQEVQAFARQGAREVGETLVQAYRVGSFTQILEFTQFLASLKLSLHRITADVDAVYLALFTTDEYGTSAKDFLTRLSPAELEIELPETGLVMDKRDLDTLGSVWLSTSSSGVPGVADGTEETDSSTAILASKSKSYREAYAVVVLRQLYLRILAYICRLAKRDEIPCPNRDNAEIQQWTGELNNISNRESLRGPHDTVCKDDTIRTRDDKVSLADLLAQFNEKFDKLRSSYCGATTQVHDAAAGLPCVIAAPSSYLDVYLSGEYTSVLQYVFAWLACALAPLSSPYDDKLGTRHQVNGVDAGNSSADLSGSHKLPFNLPANSAEPVPNPKANKKLLNPLDDLTNCNGALLQTRLRHMISQHQLDDPLSYPAAAPFSSSCATLCFPFRQLVHVSLVTQTLGCCIFALIAAKEALAVAARTGRVEASWCAGEKRTGKKKQPTTAASTEQSSAGQANNPRASSQQSRSAELTIMGGMIVAVLGTLSRLIDDLEGMLQSGSDEIDNTGKQSILELKMDGIRLTEKVGDGPDGSSEPIEVLRATTKETTHMMTANNNNDNNNNNSSSSPSPSSPLVLPTDLFEAHSGIVRNKLCASYMGSVRSMKLAVDRLKTLAKSIAS